jgi:predicted nucleotidyltransferase component of viral defense system
MSPEVKNLAASVLDRLRNKAKEMGLPFHWLLYNYANERFLYRLSQSKHRPNFVLKGGLIFVGWNIPLRRLTKDIDFRAYASNNIDDIVNIVREVCSQSVEPDAVEFKPDTIEAEAILEQNEYPGVRVRFSAMIDKTKIRMQVDLGFSDEITPAPRTLTYPTILGMPAPSLKGYSKETVIAEKLHSIIYRGSANSRRKDFYDLWFMSQQLSFKGTLLQRAIKITFKTRKTQIPTGLPVALTDGYAIDNETQWRAFLNTFNPHNDDIRDFKEVLATIRDFLVPILTAESEAMPFKLNWRAVGPWD